MAGLKDMHLHFVYGIDDGPQNAEGMYAMLDQAHENGITALYATSHSTLGMEEFPQERYAAHLDEARAYCKSKGYSLRLYAGSEVLFTPALANFIGRNPLPTLGDSNYVLVEFVPDVSYQEVEDAVDLVAYHGYVPVLAHIERYECMFHTNIAKLKDRYDVRYQVNCSTAIRARGRIRNWRIKRWFKAELIDYVASDSHDVEHRPNRLRAAYQELKQTCSNEYLYRLMGDSGIGIP